GAELVLGRFPALEDGGVPVRSDRLRPLDPGPELRLRELRVGLLELDPVRVARLEVLDEDLPGDLVLAALRDVEVDADEGVRVPVEDGGVALFLEELDVLEPVDVLAGRRREEVDVLDLLDRLLVRIAATREVLAVDLLDLLGLL